MNLRILILNFLLIISHTSDAQNWFTFGGNSTRSGYSKITGPQDVLTPLWSITSTNNTTLGNAVYTFGDRFVTSRVEFSPYTGVIECRNLLSGTLVWTTPFISTSSILYTIGFNEEAVYAHDYSTDTIYAFQPSDGSIKWRSKIKSQTFGAYPGCVFACNGDLIVNGPVASGIFTMRLNKHNGDTVWTNPDLIAIGPAVGLAANTTTVYRITGGITIPILLTAIDINTGVTKYNSTPIPGDADQENPITLGFDNEIYFWRDGGNLYKYLDTGTGLAQDWTYIPQTTTGAALFGNISIGPDQNLYVFDLGKVKRINHLTGGVMDSSIVTISQGAISIGADSTVYVNNKNGNFFAFEPDLQTIKWQTFVGGNTYNNMNLSYEGIMVFTGSGNQVTAYQTQQNLPPVADFRASSTLVEVGIPVDFFDQSSFVPIAWQWNFPGGNPGSSNVLNPTGIIYNNPGVYEVSLLAQNTFGADSIIKTCYMEVVNTTAIDEAIVSMDLKVYPNPASHTVSIYFPKNIQEFRLEAFDVTGKIIFSRIINEKETSIDVSTWDNGVYFFSSNDNSFMPVKFIKID